MSAGGFAVGPVGPSFGGGGPLGGKSVMPTSSVELTVSCTDLLDKDVFSKSDPFCVFFMKINGAWTELGRTERLKDNLNPKWQKKFIVDYSFEERQEVKFEVYDSDATAAKLEQHDFIGLCETSLGGIVSAKNKLFASVLKGNGKSTSAKLGKIFILCEELVACKEEVEIHFRAEKLDNKDGLFGKSDPFFTVSKLMPDGKYSIVYKSDVIMDNLSPTWKPWKIKVSHLCNGDYQRKLKIDILDWDSDGKHDMIGSVETKLASLVSGAVERTPMPVINATKASHKKSYKNSGLLFVTTCKIETNHSFIDYIQGGTAMNFSVAVDFTASNGHPADHHSLHFLGAGDNQYTIAIKSVGSVIEDYDTDKQFPALGFGAQLPPAGQVSHEFFLNLSPDNPYCFGVNGLLQAYNYALQHVTLYGPTNFSPVINHVARIASQFQDGRTYNVLLILTDGVITDSDATVSAIVDASALPMSIIIVGVGNENFSAMEALDCDKGLLRSQTKTAVRDIVQFVELRKFVTPTGDYDKDKLSKQVLAEIPEQVVQWMKKRGIQPNSIPK